MDCKQTIIQALIDRKILREEQGDSEYLKGGIEALEDVLDTIDNEEAVSTEDDEDVAAILLIIQGEADDDAE